MSRAELPGKQVGAKGWAGAYMNVQLAADSSGIWAIFAGPDDLLNVFQLDVNLNKVQGWRTTVAKDSVGPVFMVCGVLYALDSHYANNVAYIYNTALAQGRHLSGDRIVLPFKDLSTLHYNPVDNKLYMWTLSREESRTSNRYGRLKFTIRTRMYGVAERLYVHLSPRRIHLWALWLRSARPHETFPTPGRLLERVINQQRQNLPPSQREDQCPSQTFLSCRARTSPWSLLYTFILIPIEAAQCSSHARVLPVFVKNHMGLTDFSLVCYIWFEYRYVFSARFGISVNSKRSSTTQRSWNRSYMFTRTSW